MNRLYRIAIVLLGAPLTIVFLLAFAGGIAPDLYIQLVGEPVDYTVDYPRDSFKYMPEDATYHEEVKFNTETGRIGEKLKIAARAKLTALSIAQSSVTLMWLGNLGQKNNISYNAEEIVVIENCLRTEECGESEFEPSSTYLVRISSLGGAQSGGFKQLTKNSENLERFNHWIKRSIYYDAVLFSEYEMHNVEIAFTTPEKIYVIGKEPANISINDTDLAMSNSGYISFAEHNLSTGFYSIKINNQTEKETKIFESVPQVRDDYRDSNLRIQRKPNETVKFEKLIISDGNVSKEVTINFSRNKTWEYSSNERIRNLRMRVNLPQNLSQNYTATLTHPELNYTKKFPEDNPDSKIGEAIMGLEPGEIETLRTILKWTGNKPNEYRGWELDN